MAAARTLWALLALAVLLPAPSLGRPQAAIHARRGRAAPLDSCASLQRKLAQYATPLRLSPSSAFLFARPSEVLACTRSVAFNRARDLGTLTSIINYFKSFYGLLHVATKSPDPGLPSNYDVIKELEAVAYKPWSTAEEFYTAVAQAIDGLNDGHTALDLSCPPFLHRLALPLVGVVENGVQTVRTAPVEFLKPVFTRIALSKPFSFNPTQYAGAKVVAIEGQPAWAFVQRYAATRIHMYHDQGQRTNMAFARLAWNNGTRISSYGGFSIRGYHPGSDYVLMSLLRPGTTKPVDVAVPFIAYSPATNYDGFASTKAYYNAFCAPPQQLQQLSKVRLGLPTVPPHPFNPLKKIGRIREIPKRFAAHKDAEVPMPLKNGKLISPPSNYWKVYKLDDGKTAVVTIHTFMPDIPMDAMEDFIKAYYFFVNESMVAFDLANKNAEQVLIDVSGNGGGVTTFVPLVIELLLGTEKYAKPLLHRLNPIQILADTDVVQLLRKYNLGYFNYSGYADMAERPFTEKTAAKFFFPLKRWAFGTRGVPGIYSNLFKNAGPVLADLFNGVKTFPPAFGNKPFAIFSDGLCFSACSEFSMTLGVRFKVPVVGTGGISGVPMAYSAAGGGFVSENVADTFLPFFTPQIAALPTCPKAFGVNANLAMRFVNGFMATERGVNAAKPIEFTFAPATYKIDITPENVADPTLQYLEAAKVVFK